MKTITPPRWAERLIHASGATPDFRDEVLGDLAEEFDIRVAYDGERDARRWYALQTLRTFPHLLRYWSSSLTRSDVRRISKAIGEAYCVVAITGSLLIVSMSTVLSALGIDLGGPPLPPGTLFHRIGLPGTLLIATVCSLVGGFAASRFERRAPLASAAGLGVFWSVLSTLAAVIAGLLGVPNQTPMGWLLGGPVLVMLGTTTGGLLRVCSSNDIPPLLVD